jgi:hypothetical protein
MPRHGLCKVLRRRSRKMPEFLFGSCKSTDTSRPSIVRGQRYACKIPENSFSRHEVHGHLPGPYKTPGHKTNLCKMHRRPSKRPNTRKKASSRHPASTGRAAAILQGGPLARKIPSPGFSSSIDVVG